VSTAEYETICSTKPVAGESLQKTKIYSTSKKDRETGSSYFKVATNKNTFLQSQNDPGKCSLNLLPTEEGAREINHGDCFEASSMATLDPHHP
ncbi:hypothetical protein HPG69_011620, partial [Diceros bicornis minor]